MKAKLESISSGNKILSYFKQYFDSIDDHRKSNISISLGDALMSAYAMFSLKFPSILKFEEELKDDDKSNNIKRMYYVKNTPSDTQMRAIIDDIETEQLRTPFNELFRKLQRDNKLYQFGKVL